MSDIKLVTLKTNHTLICELDCVDDETISCKQPVQLVIQQTQQGPMMGFNPFLDYAEEFLKGIKFNVSDVLTINTPSRELINQYNKVFGSGIEIASAIPKI